jgi:Holliday junction resolvase RusA-like endonuclease
MVYRQDGPALGADSLTWTWYLLDINPEPWAIGSVVLGRREGKVYGNIGRNQQLWNYQQAVKQELKKLNPKIETREDYIICLDLYFWRELPSYQGSTKKIQKHIADATNLQKGLEDALQGVLFINDRSVGGVRSSIVAQGPEVQGRIAIGVASFPLWRPTLPTELERMVKEHEKLVEAATDNSWGTTYSDEFGTI